jgi:UDP-N-acetylmuramate--alanine ligase
VTGSAGVLGRARRFHFVGVGGIGMSGIAELLVNLGYEVSGSDMHRSDITTRLESMGVRFAEGHDARNLGDAEVLIYSSAVKPSNPEMAAALSRGLTIVPRAELLGELMGARESIAVAGAHGKTTTTSMIAVMCEAAGLDPTAVIGGRVAAFGSNARLGRGKYFIAEADESDGSFLRLRPGLAVITNIDQEHLDAYRDFEDLQRAFVTFANSVPESGAVILCADDRYLKKLRPSIVRRVVTYGLSAGADVSAGALEMDGFGSVCTVKGLGRMELSVPGRHNVLNALAAVAVGRELGLDWDAISGGLKKFQGAERRFQLRGDANGVSVVEDYGHHPTEIAAVIAAARPIAAAGRLIVAFQPHRFSRTQSLMHEFGRAFTGADAVFLTDIYAAGEESVSGVDVDALAGVMRGNFGGPVHVVKSLRDMPAALAQFARPGDLIVLLGAGSIGSIAPRVLNELSRTSRH